MLISEKQLLSRKEIVTFTLPKLHKGKSWYVDFSHLTQLETDSGEKIHAQSLQDSQGKGVHGHHSYSQHLPDAHCRMESLYSRQKNQAIH